MKKQLLTLLFAISTIISFSQVPSYVPTNGLVGYWPFNGNANDVSGNGNNGTINGAITGIDRFLVPTAYYFNGNANIFIPNAFDYPQRTVNVWFFPTIAGPSSGQIPYSFIFESRDPNLINGRSRITFTNTNVCMGYNGGVDGCSGVVLNTWNMATIVRNSDSTRHYINGEIVSSSILGFGSSGSSSGTRLGASVSGYVPFTGTIDDLAIWNRALTQQEITDLYNSCKSPTAFITPQGNTTFCQGGSVTLNATTGTNYTYEWYKDGNLINGAGSATYQANLSGNYTVKVIDGACNTTSSSTTVSVLNCASLMENNGDNTSIYPNPIKDMLNIESPFMDGNIILIDANGKTVIEMKIEDKKTKIDVKNIVPGTYNLIIKNKDQIIEKKIVKL